MRTKEEIQTKLEHLRETKTLTNYTKNFYWEQALEWVLEEGSIKNDKRR